MQIQCMHLSTIVSRVITIYSIILLCFCICEGLIQLPPNITVPAVFAYGDSIVDQGNNNDILTIAKSNFPPYGKDFPAGPTGRFGNGKTPPDLLAEELGVANLIPAYLDPNLKTEELLTGVSFASGGCGFDPETAKIPGAISLSSQLELLKEYIGKLKASVGEERTNFIISNGLHLVVAGSDDLINTYYVAGINRRLRYPDISSYADFLLIYASQFLKELYNLGARRIAVFGLPPVGCIPSQRTIAGGPTRMFKEEYNQAAQTVNSKLVTLCDSLTQSLPQSRVVYVDIYNPFLDIILRPKNYGFEVNDLGCCGTGLIEVIILCNKFSKTCPDDTKYVFWDSYHPSEKAYKLLVGPIIRKYINSFV